MKLKKLNLWLVRLNSIDKFEDIVCLVNEYIFDWNLEKIIEITYS